MVRAAAELGHRKNDVAAVPRAGCWRSGRWCCRRGRGSRLLGRTDGSDESRLGCAHDHASAAAEFHWLYGPRLSLATASLITSRPGGLGVHHRLQRLVGGTALNILARPPCVRPVSLHLPQSDALWLRRFRPVIMMSQNRQAAGDRLEDRIDYETNAHAASRSTSCRRSSTYFSTC
jgi:hypothetical protein